MSFREYFPFWEGLSIPDRNTLLEAAIRKRAPKGRLLHCGGSEGAGLMLVEDGRLRVCLLTDEGREITVYRLHKRDVCFLSAPCVVRDLRFDVAVEAEEDASVWVIPAETFRDLMKRIPAAAEFINGLMASRLSEVMWLMEQILWHRLDKRLAAVLLEEARLSGSDRLPLTHERLANHMGTAREVVTRMLHYFQDEGMIRLTRGAVELRDKKRLEAEVLSRDSG